MMKSCTCEECKEMCQRPCWPTPEEAKKLIEAGYGDRLMSDYWARAESDIHILGPALKGYEGQSTPFWPKGQCTFQDENGLCQLHDKGLKPYEGRKALCNGRTPKGLHEEVAMMWDNEEAQALVDKWYKER